MDTAEHEIVSGGPQEGGAPPRGGGRPPTVDGTEDAPAEEAVPIFKEQLLSISVASFLVLMVVLVSFQFGYETKKTEIHKVASIPEEFYLPIIGAIVVGFVAPMWADLSNGVIKGFTRQDSHLKPLPQWLLRLLVYALTVAVAFALVSLVQRTGGFVESPFTPVMTAPAAIGPFMARREITILQLSVIGIASVWLSICLLDASSLGLEPRPWVVGLMTTAMLIIAGGLSYVRHNREDE